MNVELQDLYYLQSRYYNADWGRLISADDIVGKTGELLSHNIFAYARNNPVNHVDSNGKWVVDAAFLAWDIAKYIKHQQLH
ncbi:RHS repeat-associated core domain-containing protein [Gottfriedia sp. NPDC057991]|uniref:RHS repeat-associated core domain-containing protein n=1 Tax=Gottfriedia sp. NPDC057991 TaxID=3346298 RepID=UPI0036DF44E8